MPCGPEFSHCKFIKDAYESKSLLEGCRKSLMALRRRHNQLTTKLEGMDVDTLEQERKLYNDRDKEYADLCTEATNLDLSLAKIKNKLHLLINEIASIETKIEVYELNKEAIENREELIKEQDGLKSKSIKMESDIAICDTKVLDLVKQHGGIETQIENIKDNNKNWKTCGLTTLPMICSCAVLTAMASVMTLRSGCSLSSTKRSAQCLPTSPTLIFSLRQKRIS